MIAGINLQTFVSERNRDESYTSMDRLISMLDTLSSAELSGFKGYLKKNHDRGTLANLWLKLYSQSRSQEKIKSQLLQRGKSSNAYYQLRKFLLSELEAFLLLQLAKTDLTSQFLNQLKMVEWCFAKGLFELGWKKLQEASETNSGLFIPELHVWTKRLKVRLKVEAPHLELPGESISFLTFPDIEVVDGRIKSDLGFPVQELPARIKKRLEKSVSANGGALGDALLDCLLYQKLQGKTVQPELELDGLIAWRMEFEDIPIRELFWMAEVGKDKMNPQLLDAIFARIEYGVIVNGIGTEYEVFKWYLVKARHLFQQGNWTGCEEILQRIDQKICIEDYTSLAISYYYLAALCACTKNAPSVALEYGRKLMENTELIERVLGHRKCGDFQLLIAALSLEVELRFPKAWDGTSFHYAEWEGVGIRLVYLLYQKWQLFPGWKGRGLVPLFQKSWAGHIHGETSFFEVWLIGIMEGRCFGEVFLEMEVAKKQDNPVRI